MTQPQNDELMLMLVLALAKSSRAVPIFHTRASLNKSQCNEREERSKCRTRTRARQIH